MRTDGCGVVEMNGYMPNVDGKGEEVQNGRIVILEDTDNDGRLDKSVVFSITRDAGALGSARRRAVACRCLNGAGRITKKG